MMALSLYFLCCCYISLSPSLSLSLSLLLSLSLSPSLSLQNQQYGINVCGEGGEYETFTLDCPLFCKEIIL